MGRPVTCTHSQTAWPTEAAASESPDRLDRTAVDIWRIAAPHPTVTLTLSPNSLCAQPFSRSKASLLCVRHEIKMMSLHMASLLYVRVYNSDYCMASLLYV